jgi:hypothetical protein
MYYHFKLEGDLRAERLIKLAHASEARVEALRFALKVAEDHPEKVAAGIDLPITITDRAGRFLFSMVIATIDSLVVSRSTGGRVLS